MTIAATATLEIIKERSIQIGQPVRAYLNWNKGPSTFSIVDCKSGLVVAYCSRVTIQDAVFKVSQSGRSRVLRDKCKNVHAFVRGILIGLDQEKPKALTREIYYNPYTHDEFTDLESGEVITTSNIAHLENRRVYVPPAESLFNF